MSELINHLAGFQSHQQYIMEIINCSHYHPLLGSKYSDNIISISK